MAGASPSSPLRVWILTNAPSPYQLEFLKALGQRLDLELSVRFMQGKFRGDSFDSAESGLSAIVYPSIGIPGERDELRFHPSALREICAGKHDVYVLSGLYTSPTVLLSAQCLAVRRSKYLLWLERPSERTRGDLPVWRHWLRVPFIATRFVILRSLFAGARRVFCIGTLASRQYQAMGLPEAKAAVVPYCTRTERFETPDRTRTEELRAGWGLADRFVFLFSGQLIHRKGIDTLVEAYRRVARERANTALVILGDGPMKSQVLQIAAACKEGLIVVAGHQAQADIPSCFACAHAFVFPSRHDGWGVVLNEAAAAGLPIIASNQTGAAHDLVVEQANGFRVDAEDVDALTHHMLFMVDHRSQLSTFGEKSRELAQMCSIEHGVEEFARVLLEVGRA